MTDIDLRSRMLQAHAAVTAGPTTGRQDRASTLSTLSTDESLLLAGSGWTPVDVCAGSAVFGMRRDTVNTWGSGQDHRASQAMTSAMRLAVERLEASCRNAGARGVIGTQILTEIEPRYVAVSLVGTAIETMETSPAGGRPFTSNLSAPEFVQLRRAGWQPVGLASGGRFARAYRRRPAETVHQKVQNVELVNPTRALARARAETMQLLRQRAAELGGQGVVQLSMTFGPVGFAPHVLSFLAWGTAVSATSVNPAHPAPLVAVTLDDVDTAFDPGSLTGRDTTARSRRGRYSSSRRNTMPVRGLGQK